MREKTVSVYNLEPRMSTRFAPLNEIEISEIRLGVDMYIYIILYMYIISL